MTDYRPPDHPQLLWLEKGIDHLLKLGFLLVTDICLTIYRALRSLRR